MRYRAYLENKHDGWEQARMISFYIIKTVDSKDKYKNFKDLIRLPWEEEKRKAKPLDTASMQKFSDEADELLKQINPAAYAAYMAGKANNPPA